VVNFFAMREDLLEVLREPNTGSVLRLHNAKGSGARITSGELISEQSERSYPIINGIPRFVPQTGYADSFGLQWNRYRLTQLDSVNGTKLSTNRFWSETEWTDIKDQWVLDMGCGSGRFAEVAAAAGARLVALDLSSAVEATAETLKKYENCDVVQASLLEPPFAVGAFDKAYCIGVLQHTPDPAGGCRSIARCVKPGGEFVLTIYARQPWTKLYSKYWVRPFTSKLNKSTLLNALERVMPVAFPVTDRLFRLPLLGKAARVAIPVANYVDMPELRERQLRYDFAVLDTYDMLSPEYDSPMTAREVRNALASFGLQSLRFKTEVPVNVIGVR
jgi:SAM-dependent methyltransferase